LFCFPVLPAAYLPRPRPANKKIWSLRFEKFEEDFISVVLRIVHQYCFCFSRHCPRAAAFSQDHFEPAYKPASSSGSHNRQNEIAYFFNSSKRSGKSSSFNESTRSCPG
jgi:hypothetical protein